MLSKLTKIIRPYQQILLIAVVIFIITFFISKKIIESKITEEKDTILENYSSVISVASSFALTVLVIVIYMYYNKCDNIMCEPFPEI